MTEITEFYGVLKWTPMFAKCDPLYTEGHWTLKENPDGKPWRVWCDEGLYTHGINENICEIYRVDRIVKEVQL